MNAEEIKTCLCLFSTVAAHQGAEEKRRIGLECVSVQLGFGAAQTMELREGWKGGCGVAKQQDRRVKGL